MSQEEVQKYINEVAFSGAEEFLEQYKDSAKDSGINRTFWFGLLLGFYGRRKSGNQNPITQRGNPQRIGYVMDLQNTA